MKFKRTLTLIVLIIAAIALGSFVGDIFSGVSSLSWLDYTVAYTLSPFTFDIKIIQLTFGFSLSINVAQIVFLVIAVLLYPKVKGIICAE